MTAELPPIPLSLAHRPAKGGVAQPWVNAALADGGVDFRSAHQSRFARAWQECLCQSCGNRAGPVVVLFGGPNQILTRRFTEPPLCLPCAAYAGKACPMVAGRMFAYPDRPRVTEGKRGESCGEPGCDCGGWQVADPENSADHGGTPAHPWYAIWLPAGGYSVTAHEAMVRCSDLGCEHKRLMVNGALVTAAPRKTVLVSEPWAGRVWRRLEPGEAESHARGALERLGWPLPEGAGAR